MNSASLSFDGSGFAKRMVPHIHVIGGRGTRSDRVTSGGRNSRPSTWTMTAIPAETPTRAFPRGRHYSVRFLARARDHRRHRAPPPQERGVALTRQAPREGAPHGLSTP